MKTWQSWLVITAGVLLAAHTSAGILYSSVGSLVLAVLLISFFNTVLRPVLVLFTLPFIIFSLGLGLVFINAALLKLVAWIVPGFEVLTWVSAFWGALVIGITHFFANQKLGGKQEGKPRVNVSFQRHGPHARKSPRPARERISGEDVIDI